MHKGLFATTLLLLITSSVFAQRVHTTNVNKDKEHPRAAFSFVHLTDIHVGEHIDDYGTPGYYGDTMPAGDVGYAAERLRNAVNWINKNAHKRNIKFAIVTGDLTDSGEKSEFDKVNEILSTLTVPFIPQIGNHDVVSHNATDRAPTALGDSLCNLTFHAEFDTLRKWADKWDDGYRLTKVYSPYSRHEQYFQNFKFAYQGYEFVFCDLNPRFIYGRPKTDHGPNPRLNDFPNASFEWLTKSLAAQPDSTQHNVIICTHQPPHHDFMSIFNGLPTPEYNKLTQTLLPYRSHLALWLAGHVHRFKAYTVHTLHGHKAVIKARETGSNKEHRTGKLRVVNVYSR